MGILGGHGVHQKSTSASKITDSSISPPCSISPAIPSTIESASKNSKLNLPRYNKLAQDHLRIPTIRSYEEDANRDGMKDMLHLEMEVPLSDAEMMQGVSILLLFVRASISV